MHIIVANNIYPPIMAGGAELIVSYLCEGLANRGHRVTVISTCGPEMEPYPVEMRNGVEVIRYFPRNRYWTFARAALKGQELGFRDKINTARWHLKDAWNRDAGRHARAIFMSSRPDVLHTHVIDGFSATIWYEAKRIGIPVIHTAHDYHLICPRAFLLSRSWQICSNPTLACRLYRFWHLHTSENVDLFASPSKFLLGLHAEAGLQSAESAIVPSGVPLPASKKPVRSVPFNRFLLLSRLTVEKGIRVVLEAMARLPKNIDLEVSIGGRGPLESEVLDAASKDSRIRFLGYVQGEAKEAALNYADHLLLPSLWYENSPVVILEAAAWGLSLIGSRIGAIPEFVREGFTGRLFAPGNAHDLAETMVAAMTDAGLHIGLETNGAMLISNFTVDRMVDSYLGHYERLVQRAV